MARGRNKVLSDNICCLKQKVFVFYLFIFYLQRNIAIFRLNSVI
jgi:hypothetical protein